jgi:hypothetical protein
MKPGETVQLECPACYTKSAVTYEPEAPEGIPDSGVPVGFCPFCGEEIIVQ